MTNRILSSIALAAMAMTVVQPAFAAATSTDEVLAELASFKPETICKGRTNRNLGKCIGDVIKRIGSLRNDFNQALGVERKAWYEAHGHLGVSGEYQIQLQEYLAGVKSKRHEFTELQRGLEKAFFAARKEVRENATSETNIEEDVSESPRITSVDIDAATAKCANESSARGLRICLRLQLRLQNPNTQLLNITPYRTRSTQ